MSTARRLRHFCSLLTLGLCALLWQAQSPHAQSAAVCDLGQIPSDVRPGPPGEPVEVAVGFRLIDVTQIEDISQTITADFLLLKTWRDTRLSALAGCQFAPERIWTPKIDVVNSGRLFDRLQERVEILEGGEVRYLQRLRGAIVFPYQARRFPFDRHEIAISLLSVEFGLDDVAIVVEEQITGASDEGFNIPDWDITGLRTETGPFFMEVYQRDHARLDVIVSAERRSGYYVWKILMPLVLIVAMSWTVFWIDPAHFGAQVSMSSASMLTLIAFHFAMVSILPPLSYFTVLDSFIAASTFIVFLALIESITTSYLVSCDRREIALKMDRVCRWVFPASFALISAIIFAP